MRTKVSVLAFLLLLSIQPAFSGVRIGPLKVRFGGDADKVTDRAGRVVENIQNTKRQAGADMANAGHQGVQDIGVEWDRGRRRTGDAFTKARKDTVDEVIRTPKNLDRARLALQRYAYRETQGLGDTLTDAERRVRQGKFADAIWHLAVDPLRHTEKNAGRLAQESSIVRAIGQVAATAYGGAPGAAAFAAWYTYSQTKDPELALRVGIITGATSFAFGEVNKIPSTEIDALTGKAVISATAVTRKAVIAGAIGGLAVAASGGDKKALRDGFLYSGGTILVQDFYQTVTKHPLDARSSEGEAYAMQSMPGEPFAPPEEAYIRDSDGTVLLDKDNNPLVDVRKTNPLVPHVGRQSGLNNVSIVSERSAAMTAVSRVPAMNAMALLHDHLAFYFDMNPLTSVGTIAPAIYVTFIGTGTQMYDLIQKTGVKSTAAGRKLHPESGYNWVDSDDSDDLNVKWIPGSHDPDNPHLVASLRERQWAPEVGYDWVSSASNDYRVRWTPGDRDPSAHLIAGPEEGTWGPELGYTWVDPNDPANYTVTSLAPAKAVRAIRFRATVAHFDRSRKTFWAKFTNYSPSGPGGPFMKVFNVPDDAEVTIAGRQATLRDLPVGERVTGSYIELQDGTLLIKALRSERSNSGAVK